MVRRMTLTDAGIARLAPRAREYTVWDARVAGLGVRVRPSGSRNFVYHRRSETGMRKMSFGPARFSKVEEVRRSCLAAAGDAIKAREEADKRAPLFRDFAAGPWKSAVYDRCKSSTQKGYRANLGRQLLPAFGSLPLDRIARVAVTRWFETYSKTAPGNANRALTLLLSPGLSG